MKRRLRKIPPVKREASENTVEVKWLVHRIRSHWIASGLSKSAWIRSIGLSTNQINVTFLLQKKRGMTFFLAVRLATACGIDLSELQKKISGGGEKPS